LKKTLWASLGIICLLVAIIVIRTIRFASRQIQVPPSNEISFAAGAAVKRLSLAIQHKTVSEQNLTAAAGAEFARFHQLLSESFPAVHSRLVREVIGGYSLLYTWKGKDESLKPLLLIGHMDVVPVDPESEKLWTYPPFSGQIGKGYIWGRGAMDDKVNVLAILESVEHLLSTGFQPQRTLYLAFGHDEEVGGENGAAKIAALLHARKIDLEYVLDEGGTIIDAMFPGIAAPVALIGIAEKGYLSLELTVETPGGHASTPPPHTAVGILSSAIHKLEGAPFPSYLRGPTRQLLEAIGPEMPWSKRLIFANLWLFEPVVKKQMAQSPATNAMIRTTQAATLFEAGVKENILPTKARAVVNFRILTGDTLADVENHVRNVINDPRVKIAPLQIRMEPSAITDTESASFKLLHRTVRQIIPEAIVAPWLLVAATDSRHYAKLTKSIYRFVPFTVRPDDIQRFHGIDERISARDYERCIRFFMQLIKNSQSQNFVD
jgi:carboxypeptidase PM20D1